MCSCCHDLPLSLLLLLLLYRREAHREAANEPLLSSFLYASVLGHDCFERSLAFVLAERLQNNVMLVSQLFDTFYQVGGQQCCSSM